MVGLSLQLGAALEESKTTHLDTTVNTLAGLTAAQLAERHALLSRRVQELIAAEAKPPAPPLPSPFDTPAVIEPPPPVENPESAEPHAPEPPARKARPVCEFCRQSLTRCADIQATNLEVWRTLHYNDPAERERRSQEATAVMLKQMPYGHKGWY